MSELITLLGKALDSTDPESANYFGRTFEEASSPRVLSLLIKTVIASVKPDDTNLFKLHDLLESELKDRIAGKP